MTIVRIGAWIMGALALLSLGFLGGGLFFPSTWSAEATREMAVSTEEIFPFLEEGEAWLAWTPGPESGVEAVGPESGVGSGYRWDDPGYGKGAFTLTAVAPGEGVRYQVEVEGGSIQIEGSIRLVSTENGTRVEWKESGDFGWNPLLRYLSGRMAELQGEQLALSLETLEAKLLEVQSERSSPEGEDRSAEPRS
jgi:hypothetical protein